MVEPYQLVLFEIATEAVEVEQGAVAPAVEVVLVAAVQQQVVAVVVLVAGVQQQ